MKNSVKFYLEKRKGIVTNMPIYLNVTFGGKRLNYYTGKRCDLTQWTGEKITLKKNCTALNGQSADDFNSDLDRIKIAVKDLFKAYDLKKIKPEVEMVRDDLNIKLGKKKKRLESDLFFDRFQQYADEKNKSKKEVTPIHSIMKQVKKFKPDLSFETLSVKVLTDLHNFMVKENNICENSASSYLLRLRGFLKYAKDNRWTDANPFEHFKIKPVVYGDPVYLTLEERDILYNANIQDTKLALIRDMFVLQSLIGCRIGDLQKMTPKNIINKNIEYIAGKTKDHKPRTATIPLCEKAMVIINRNITPQGTIFPNLYVYDINGNIKKLFTDLGLTRMVTIPDRKTRENKQVPICEIASSHMARRVFIGGLHKKGVKDAVIASMSGHVKNSQAFARYYNIDNEDQKAAISLIE